MSLSEDYNCVTEVVACVETCLSCYHLVCLVYTMLNAGTMHW